MAVSHILTNVVELRRELFEILRSVLQQLIPPLIEAALRKPYLTREEVKDLTGWSDRQLQHLRDSRRIPFSQYGRTVLYPTKEFYAFLDAHRVVPRNSDCGDQ